MVQSYQSRQPMKKVGWWHFELSVPKDWDIVAQGQSRDVEIFRLADSFSVRLEVSLEKTPFEKAKSVDELLEAFRKNWEKRLGELKKKEGIEAELKHAFKEDIEVYGHRGALWGFRVGGALMMAAVWYCEKSERSISLTFTPRSPDEKDLFLTILRDSKCHFSTAAERALWSTLLFDIHLPQKYRLVAAKFTALSSYCVFEDPEGPEYLLVGYSGLASVVLDRYKKGIREWFEKNILKESMKSLRIEIPKLKYEKENDDMITFKGETFSLLKSKKKMFIGKIWLDKKIDRILTNGVYTSITRREDAVKILEDLFDQMQKVSI